MPKSAADAKAFDFLRLLVLGPPKVGKTQTIISTAPKPVYVILSDDEAALQPAARVVGPKDFFYDEVNSTQGPKLLQQAEAAWREAIEGAKAGRYKSIVWDTMTSFAGYLVNAELVASTNQNGNEVPQTAYPSYARRLTNYVGRLLAAQAHVIVLAHDVKESKELPGQLAKHGVGIVPGIAGSVRGNIAGKFQDVVYLEKRKGDGAGVEKRMFVTNIDGVYGIGCRNLPGYSEVPADVEQFYKLSLSPNVKATEKKPSTTKPMAKPAVKPAATSPIVSKPAPKPVVKSTIKK